MADYKAAKEAFVSDNLGASVSSINAVSLPALATYAIWITLSPHLARSGFASNYLLNALPILLGVTVFATSPIIYTCALTLLALLFHTRSQSSLKQSTKQLKSKGQWLDESDSDEEAAEPASASGSTTVSPVRLPSQVAFSSGVLLSPESASPISPGSPAGSAQEDPLGIMGVNRRRSLQPGGEGYAFDPLLKGRISPVPLRLGKPRKRKVEEKEETGAKPRLPFLTVYRAHMMLMTVICILAVDFEVFPRWQGKCEQFGTSLMDVGVGSFVFSLGLISTKTLSPPPPAPLPTSPAMNSFALNTTPSSMTSIITSLRKSVPILVLGFLRLIMVKGSDYPEHVTEYGVHWNFFFTLALVPVLAVGVRPLTRWLKWSWIGVIVSLSHQAVLHHYVQDLVLSPVRSNLLLANKEGLASLPGYLAIFLLGLATGDHVLRLSLPPRGRTVSENEEEHEQSHMERKTLDLIMELVGYSVGWWSLLGLWLFAGGEVSRQMANTPYVLWVAAYNTSFLLGYLLLSHFLPTQPTSSSSSSPSSVPPLLEAMNKNSLVIFLVANLLTGLVNVTMETMYVGKWVAMGVLGVYTAGVAWVGWALKGKRIQLT
ncbi:GPI-anchored wall transfer protein 1 [Cryptococcus amylolentus CBS 6039]|uniref:GPI-anchored wall transfer protein n=2 Tax=Cryptococcus amylolentus TaxID=104669 RepID=A0A1E3HZ45_9TREE|nr:GPI-anchored wall transfer protein 1 [Cryptococcus amylolentus CBS 6039]ODN81579.1 GPI-anchored wall transfer protein 1 [Cryptococcus amylolentus CBS 6039]ODO10199.1 GPI-anchored wall transfer protein 1 [Cryptococcus amylolentus CBS 6273]